MTFFLFSYGALLHIHDLPELLHDGTGKELFFYPNTALTTGMSVLSTSVASYHMPLGISSFLCSTFSSSSFSPLFSLENTLLFFFFGHLFDRRDSGDPLNS